MLKVEEEHEKVMMLCVPEFLINGTYNSAAIEKTSRGLAAENSDLRSKQTAYMKASLGSVAKDA